MAITIGISLLQTRRIYIETPSVFLASFLLMLPGKNF